MVQTNSNPMPGSDQAHDDSVQGRDPDHHRAALLARLSVAALLSSYGIAYRRACRSPTSGLSEKFLRRFDLHQ